MVSCTLTLYDFWKKRLSYDEQTDSQSIAAWLLSCPSDRLHRRSPYHIIQRIDYRYRILKKRYLHQPTKKAYRHLIMRLFTIVVKHPHLAVMFRSNQQKQSLLIGLIHQMINHLTAYNEEIKITIDWIGKCSNNSAIREALVLASLEEYCTQLIDGQPMVINYLQSLLSQSVCLNKVS